MTPKEKADELVNKMARPLDDDYYVDFNNYSKELLLLLFISLQVRSLV